MVGGKGLSSGIAPPATGPLEEEGATALTGLLSGFYTPFLFLTAKLEPPVTAVCGPRLAVQ